MKSKKSKIRNVANTPLWVKCGIFFAYLNIILSITGYNFVTTLFSRYMSFEDMSTSRLVTVPYRAFALGVALMTLLLSLKQKIHLNKNIYLLIFLWILILIRLFYDWKIRDDIFVSDEYWRMTLLFAIPITLIPSIGVLNSIEYINFRKLLIYSFGLVALTVLLVLILNPDFLDEATHRLYANVALNTISAGHMGLTGIILSAYLLRYEKTNLPVKILIILVMLMSGIIWLRAGSRGPILTAAVVFAVFILGVTRYKLLNLTVLLIISLICFLFFDKIIDFFGYISPIIKQRLMSENQLLARDELYTYAINAFLDSPLVGRDFAVYKADGGAVYCHNMILDTFMQTGIFGGLIMIYLVVISFTKTIKLLESKATCGWIGLLLVQNIMGCMVSTNFYGNTLITMCMIIVFIVSDVVDEGQKDVRQGVKPSKVITNAD